MRRIILASESPRRRELMAKLDVPFTVKGAQIDETLNKELPLYEAIEDIAYRKAAAVAKNIRRSGSFQQIRSFVWTIK